MDEVLQAQFPTVMAPRFTAMEPMTETGERFIITEDRVLFEVSRPWLHAVRAVSKPFERRTPYGPGLKEGVTMRCGPFPGEYIADFRELALQAFPNETAAWVTWDEDEKFFNFVPLEVTSASTGHVTFERPCLPAGVHLVMDIHSHGPHAAFFSEQDDRDDRDQLCISGVMSLQDMSAPVLVTRLSMLGVYTHLNRTKPCKINTASASTC